LSLIFRGIIGIYDRLESLIRHSSINIRQSEQCEHGLDKR